MISTVPFRRTGRAAPFGPGGDQASPGPSHAGGPRCLSSAAEGQQICRATSSAHPLAGFETGRGWPAPGRSRWRRAPPRLDPHDDQPHRAGQTSRACTHFASRSPSIGAAIGGGRPRPSAGRRRRVRSPAGTRRRQRPDSPDPSTDSNGGARRLGSEEPVCKLSRALPSSHAAENHAVRCTRRRPVWAISDTPRITGKLVQGRRKRRSGPGRIRGGGWT